MVDMINNKVLPPQYIDCPPCRPRAVIKINKKRFPIVLQRERPTLMRQPSIINNPIQKINIPSKRFKLPARRPAVLENSQVINESVVPVVIPSLIFTQPERRRAAFRPPDVKRFQPGAKARLETFRTKRFGPKLRLPFLKGDVTDKKTLEEIIENLLDVWEKVKKKREENILLTQSDKGEIAISVLEAFKEENKNVEKIITEDELSKIDDLNREINYENDADIKNLKLKRILNFDDIFTVFNMYSLLRSYLAQNPVRGGEGGWIGDNIRDLDGNLARSELIRDALSEVNKDTGLLEIFFDMQEKKLITAEEAQIIKSDIDLTPTENFEKIMRRDTDNLRQAREIDQEAELDEKDAELEQDRIEQERLEDEELERLEQEELLEQERLEDEELERLVQEELLDQDSLEIPPLEKRKVEMRIQRSMEMTIQRLTKEEREKLMKNLSKSKKRSKQQSILLGITKRIDSDIKLRDRLKGIRKATLGSGKLKKK